MFFSSQLRFRRKFNKKKGNGQENERLFHRQRVNLLITPRKMERNTHHHYRFSMA